MRAKFVLFIAALLVLVSPHVRAAEHEFRYKRPEAQSVAVMSEFNGWKAVPMTKGSDGVWSTRVDLPPGTHGYKFLVNGTEWVLDPVNGKRKTVDGVENSAVEIKGAEAPTPAPRATATPSPLARPAFTATPAAAATPASVPALSPTPGEILIFEAPLSAKRRAEAAREDYRGVMNAKVAIAVPPGFDAQKTWPVFVVANTERYSNIDSLRQFKQAALDEGWVIVAADAVEAEKNTEGGCRWPTLGAAFDHLTTAWPAMKMWPIACGGMSGGAKNSSFLAADLADERYKVIGILMMGCNQDMATVAYRKKRPPGFLQTAVFLSSGKSDAIATPEHHEYVKGSLRHSGFRKVRLENFDGAHDIYQPHIREALRWFLAQSSAAPSASPTPGSSLDIFKKKP
ncbi:MAG TPA: glycogen-binding domain-containing protein [Chthoniobacterales bacterium]|nr:glycogen-binding domain-containing protein [Chthoniobacterales bacterium]